MSDKPAICFVTRKWPPAMGGMETYCLRLSEELAALCSVERIVLPGLPNGQRPGLWAHLRFGLSTAYRLLVQRSEAVVFHFGDMSIWPLALSARMRAPKTRIVLSAHGTDVSYPRRGGLKGTLYGLYLRAGGFLLKNALVLANSATTAQETGRYGFRHVQIIPLASDIQCTNGYQGSNRLLFSGRLVKRKGLAWFVQEVLPRLPASIGVDVAGTVWDASEAKALDDERVTLLGRLDREELTRRYAEALCVIVPNIDVAEGEFEGFGLVATEAAAAGGVVLAADHSGLREAVLDDQTGFLLPSGDASTWEARIREIASWSDTERQGFTRKATAITKDFYTWERVAADTLAAYGLGIQDSETRTDATMSNFTLQH